MRKLSLYILRWQLSTPILAAAVYLLPGGTFTKAAVANLIGALIFFRVDKWIMTQNIDSTE